MPRLRVSRASWIRAAPPATRARPSAASIAEITEAVWLMGWHQLGQKLDDQQVAEIVSFLEALTGEVDAAYVAKPTLP